MGHQISAEKYTPHTSRQILHLTPSDHVNNGLHTWSSREILESSAHCMKLFAQENVDCKNMWKPEFCLRDMVCGLLTTVDDFWSPCVSWLLGRSIFMKLVTKRQLQQPLKRCMLLSRLGPTRATTSRSSVIWRSLAGLTSPPIGDVLATLRRSMIRSEINNVFDNSMDVDCLCTSWNMLFWFYVFVIWKVEALTPD